MDTDTENELDETSELAKLPGREHDELVKWRSKNIYDPGVDKCPITGVSICTTCFWSSAPGPCFCDFSYG